MTKKNQVYSAAHIANFFLDKAHEEGRGVDNLKLQKLVYIGYGWALALLGRKLFEEKIEAWKHGPVIPSLYHEFKHYRWNPIEEFSLQIDWDKEGESGAFVEPRISLNDHEANFVLSTVWDTYKRFSGTDLRAKTHEAGTPWKRTYKTGMMGLPIPDDLIQGHFQKKIREYLDAASTGNKKTHSGGRVARSG